MVKNHVNIVSLLPNEWWLPALLPLPLVGVQLSAESSFFFFPNFIAATVVQPKPRN